MKRLSASVLLLFVLATVGYVVLSAPWRKAEPAPFVASEDVREPIPAQSTIEVRYIANEGVLISSRDKRVLIDGLHRKYDDAYAFLPDAEREKIEAARPPFENIDLVLVSHYHGDHFHPESVGSYLKNSPKAILATSQQVVDEVVAKYSGYEAVKNRITPLAYSLKSRNAMKLAGIDVEVLSVGHGSGRHASIQNLGHVITLGGKKFLHIGDADTNAEIFDAFDLEQQSIDVALLPYWFLISKGGREIVERHIKPKHIIAVHVGPAEGAEVEGQVKQYYPNAEIFKTMLEKRNL